MVPIPHRPVSIALLLLFMIPLNLAWISSAGAAQHLSDAGRKQTLEKNKLFGREMMLDGRSSNDPDSDQRSFLWYGPFGTAEGATPNVFLPEGQNSISLIVNDGSSYSGLHTIAIEIVPCFRISVSSQPGKVQLRWPLQENVERYNIYRADEPELSSFQKIAISTSISTSFIDSTVRDGTVYFYVIESIGGDGSCYSDLLSSKPVTWRDNMNNDPMLFSIPVSRGIAGINYNYDVNATDTDGDLISFRLTVNPDEMSIDAVTGLIVWTPDNAGSYDVTVEVVDGNGGTDSQSFLINVEPLPEGLGDNDKDEYSVVDGDCDDYNPAVNPGAVEICNGIDDDCDTAIDEGFDMDEDGTPDCFDICPDDSDKTEPGACGCGVKDRDSDSDGTPDCNDLCADDPKKTAPGNCGCGVADTDIDTDEDGVIDCLDECIDNPAKTEAGPCGCDLTGTDTDEDGTPDCIDSCIDDPNKTEPGICGCGIADTDADNDGMPDCNDNVESSELQITDDTMPPVLLLPPDATLDATDPSGAVYSFTVRSADNADPLPVIECDPSSGSVFPVGETTVNCLSRDLSGNTSNGSFTVIVNEYDEPSPDGADLPESR